MNEPTSTVRLYEPAGGNNLRCLLCPHDCVLPPGGTGFCGIRVHRENRIYALTYGVHSGIALDPIEKKPLRHFHPGAMILSVGGYGCNMRCGFCQNHGLLDVPEVHKSFLDLPALAEKHVADGNIGVAYTYNEPLINFEYVLDCAKAIHAAGLKNILVTNGLINPEPLKALLPYIHAMNIDLKGFTDDYYNHLAGLSGEKSAWATVMNTITTAHALCHIEITTLVIPGENEAHVIPIAQWLANINPAIPLHISRFFPRHQYADRVATPVDVIRSLTAEAKKCLKHVYAGNV